MSYEENRVSLLSFPHLYIFSENRSDWIRNILRNIIHIKKLKLLDFLLLALYSAVIFAAYVYDLHIIDFIAVRIDVVCLLA